MVEEGLDPKPFSMPATAPGGTPATPATPSHRTVFIAAGIIVLVIVIAATLLLSGVIDTSPDPIVGTWNVGSTTLRMQFGSDGTATLHYPDTGDYAVGRWQKVAENRYQLTSASGTTSPLLTYDPIADTLQTGDYTLVFSRAG